MRKRWVTVAALGLLLAAVLVLLAGAEGARWPAEPGVKGSNVKKSGKLQVDVTNAQEGYIQASLQRSSTKRMKLRIKKGNDTLTYDLNGDARYEVFPLQLGSGKYEITLYENVKGKNYSAAGSVSVNVKFADPEVCFYYPNQYVNYTPETAAVLQADELCAGMEKKEAYDAVRAYMKRSFTYDYIKAINIKSGMLPDIDGAWSKRMGICQDLSAITCCMLRTQGVPARLMIGMADKNYHAWVVVTIDGQERLYDPTAAVNGISNVKSYTVERFY